MEKQILLGSLDSGEGLRLTVLVQVEDEQGAGMDVVEDIQNMFSAYIDEMAAQQEPEQDDFQDAIDQLRRNLEGLGRVA